MIFFSFFTATHFPRCSNTKDTKIIGLPRNKGCLFAQLSFVREKEKNTIVGQLLTLDLFAMICGYYFIETINMFVKRQEWWYDLLVVLIVICEMVYNWLQLLNYKKKIPNLVVILTSITLSAILSGIYIGVIWGNIQNKQSYQNNLVLAAIWICMLVIGNIVLWNRYKKNN